jgi:hypothetical protein
MQVNDTAECCQIDSTGHNDEDVVYALDWLTWLIVCLSIIALLLWGWWCVYSTHYWLMRRLVLHQSGPSWLTIFLTKAFDLVEPHPWSAKHQLPRSQHEIFTKFWTKGVRSTRGMWTINGMLTTKGIRTMNDKRYANDVRAQHKPGECRLYYITDIHPMPIL